LLEIDLTFLYDCWFDGLVHLQPLDNLDIVCRLLPVASSTLVIRVVGRRASSSVLAAHEPDRSRCDYSTPAGFSSAATSAFYFLRRSNGGTSSCSFERVVSSVTYLSLFRYFICPIIYLSASISKRGTVIGSCRERYRFVCHLSTLGSNYNRGDSGQDSEIDNREYNSAMLTCGVRLPPTYVFSVAYAFPRVRIFLVYDERDSAMLRYVIRRRAHSTDVRLPAVRT